MIITNTICDICGKNIPNNYGEVLLMKFSTDNIAFALHTKNKLNENPSLIITIPNYIQLCVNCIYDLIHKIASEQKWGKK